jgi:toxin ParE1/3/4
LRLLFDDAALQDISAAVDYYLIRATEKIAARLLIDINDTKSTLLEFPLAGRVFGRRGARIVTLTRFPYSLVYRVGDDVITVLALAAHKRRPGYWMQRGKR